MGGLLGALVGGWVAARCSFGAVIVGTLAVLIYVVIGGFLAVAWTDFIQMIVLVVGLSIIAVFASDLAGGSGQVIAMAQNADLFKFRHVDFKPPFGPLDYLAVIEHCVKKSAGVDTFTVERLRPQMKTELDKRIMASADLIGLS